MIGRFYIDGRDAYHDFGVFIAEGGYDELLEYPPLKELKSNDWQEEDGKEFDLSAPVLDSQEVSLKFAAHGAKYNIGAFVELLSDKSYHAFEFRDLGRTYSLRLVSSANLTLANCLGLVALRFADDFPLENYTYQAPQSSLVIASGCKLDGVSLSRYGVYALNGSRGQIEAIPAVKKNLLQNIASQRGAIYDGEEVTYQTKEVKLNCLMRANSLSEFWRNYNALLFDLSRPNERILYVPETGCQYPCYYKSCSNVRFVPIRKIWFEFTLGLVFTSFRVRADEYILASEQNEIIVSEDGIYAIDLD